MTQGQAEVAIYRFGHEFGVDRRAVFAVRRHLDAAFEVVDVIVPDAEVDQLAHIFGRAKVKHFARAGLEGVEVVIAELGEVAQESAQFGLIIFISFLAAISVNLGILNLIPIPVLDGGQLLFLAYEAIMHREPSARTQAFLTSIGAAVLLTLTVFAVFNDIKGL